ncbi:sensor histidine kinase [Kordiimonas sp.]|uniref:sensor histidine kinase n=1 Tax=Kordiimonas sp. TaxID=1970157 RepID=UPI003A8F06CB
MKLQNGTWLVLHKNMSEQFRMEERFLALMAGKSALEEELEQFLYATSHDLQEPLRNIAEFAALLEVESGPNLSDDAQMCLDYIGKSTVRARQMIAGLLELSRTRRKKPQPVSIKVKEFVQSLLVERAAACKTVAMDVDIDESCVITADFDLLSTVLSKLLDNALTYRRSDADHEVSITAARKRNRLEISVVDNGIGFDPIYQGEIFTIFRRLVPRSRYPGVGVGLSIAQAAARAMNGTVYSEGRPNKTVFALSIPYSARHP